MPNDRAVLEPGPDHPISIRPSGDHVTVTAHGVVVADTHRALELSETSYAPVLYIPLADVRAEMLQPSEHHTYCPYKGEASYYDVAVEGREVLDAAVWYYPDPYPAVAEIAGHVAFYRDRVEILREV
jgi:uncharacterized protein (DUF427 family)